MELKNFWRKEKHMASHSAASVATADAFLSGAPREVEAQMRRLGREEWRLWLTAVAVSLLSVVAFSLLAIPQLFHLPADFFRVEPNATAKGLLGLLLLFNLQAARRQWEFRNARRKLTHQLAGPAVSESQGEEFLPALPLDPLTGLFTQASAEPMLGKEMAWARREGRPLTLLMLEVDGFSKIVRRHGENFGETVLREFARRLQRATRGSDLIVRSSSDEFLIVLRECAVKDVQHILDRVGTMEMQYNGEAVSLEFSSSWADYQPGESPREFVQRARETLLLYKTSDDSSVSAS
jgi:diguanylate cyclase (GGDEF)-like protein